LALGVHFSLPARQLVVAENFGALGYKPDKEKIPACKQKAAQTSN